MHVETTCPGCQRKLRVAKEHAGQPARCPICNTVYTVPDLDTVQSTDPHDRWRLKTPEGLEYGPVSRSVLDGWVAEGRVSDDCQLVCEADGTWRGAEWVYPVLRPAPVAATWTPSSERNDFTVSDDSQPVARRRYVMNPDRGGIILALGILSWAIGCPIFGVLAWVMGNSDLREMQEGRMDSRGRGLTDAGRLIGMLHALLTLVALVIGVGCLLVWGVFG